MVNHEKRMLKYPTQFSNEQKSLIYGSLLGDACIHKPKNRKYARFQVKHSIAQTAYLKHKFDIMRPWINYDEPAISDDKSGYIGLPRIVFYTTSHPLFNEIHSEFYEGKTKIVTPSILNKIDKLALAFWFSDDGTYIHTPANYSHIARISTESFTTEENEMIRDWFKDRWNIKCSLQSKGNNIFRLHFSNVPARELTNLIKPYVIPEMLFKTELPHNESSPEFPCDKTTHNDMTQMLHQFNT